MTGQHLIWLITGFATAGVILRPFGIAEAWFAAAGALALVVFGLLPAPDAWQGIGQGDDVYLFLTGMMVLAELAADQGFFAWSAAWVANRARGSAQKLFVMVYLMAVCVTVFLSNDATAVVFTPAVAAMARSVRAARPMPYLLICAFVANAASFVLPISNPANLVVYGAKIPKLWLWLAEFGPASAAAILATYALLRMTQAGPLRQHIQPNTARLVLPAGGRHAAIGLGLAAIALLAASASGFPLGLATFLCSLATAAVVLIPARQSPANLLKHISWGILPLVAGLFVMVKALDRAGTEQALAALLGQAAARHPGASFWGMGAALGCLTNLVNNLPAGLLAGHALGQAHLAPRLTAAALLGIDLGPNLSVTGSLATILWIAALRREGIKIGAWRFFCLGAIIMPTALFAGLLALRLTP